MFRKSVLTMLAVLAAGCGSATTVTRTASAPAPRTVTVHTSKPVTRTVTRTVTTKAAPASASNSWSGQGDRSFGTVDVPTTSTLKWTCSGECSTFSIGNSGADDVTLDVSSSDQHSGDTVVDPGTYHAVHLITGGTWTIKIVPNG